MVGFVKKRKQRKKYKDQPSLPRNVVANCHLQEKLVALCLHASMVDLLRLVPCYTEKDTAAAVV